MQKKQVFNPFLPLNEYIPDGEPHIFDGRVYHYGSHDKEGGYTFCMLDYVTYSAPVDDLSDWRYEGVIYRADQDPQYPKLKYMYAPDVVKGNDGKYYLYYAMGGDYGYGGYIGPISVAVAETPVGPFEFLGFVRNQDGSPMEKYVCFDPAVINDDGVIRLYYGTWYGFEEEPDYPENESYINLMMEMFGMTKEEILSYPDSCMGAIGTVLEDDMLTVKEEPKHIIPYKVKGTTFEQHPFFEGPSMRKVKDKYYFVYSSWQNHELCYATSDYPDRDFTFGGTIVSNGDVGYNGRKEEDKLNMTGTTHGSIIEIEDQWYVFYHRLTHRSDYSRQACAEKIEIAEDGSITQVEITSAGLNDGPLKAEGDYPAVIACNITDGLMPHGSNSVYSVHFPNVNNIGDDRFIANIDNETLIGYKYFEYKGVNAVKVKVRIENESNLPRYDGPERLDERCGDYENKINERAKIPVNEECRIEIMIVETGDKVAVIPVDLPEGDPLSWHELSVDVSISDGVHPLYLKYYGDKKIQVKSVGFICG